MVYTRVTGGPRDHLDPETEIKGSLEPETEFILHTGTRKKN